MSEHGHDPPSGAPEEGAVERPGPNTASVVLVGNELLSGRVEDRNGPYLIRQLRQLGVDLRSLHMVPDEADAIAEVVGAAARRCDVVLTSGGVGPTHDDVTLEGVALAFGVPLVENQALRERVERFYADEKGTMEAWLKMSQVPEGTCLVYHGEGRWPVYRMENVYVLPGTPENLQRQFQGVRRSLRGVRVHLRTLYLRLDEGQLARPLVRAAQDFPGVTLGSYPVQGEADYQVRVSIESRVLEQLDLAYRWLIGVLPRGSIYKIVDG